jgi:hypothetical protein
LSLVGYSRNSIQVEITQLADPTTQVTPPPPHTHTGLNPLWNCYQMRCEGVSFSFPESTQNHKYLRSTCKKPVKVSHNKESHKMKF